METIGEDCSSSGPADMKSVERIINVLHTRNNKWWTRQMQQWSLGSVKQLVAKGLLLEVGAIC